MKYNQEMLIAVEEGWDFGGPENIPDRALSLQCPWGLCQESLWISSYCTVRWCCFHLDELLLVRFLSDFSPTHAHVLGLQWAMWENQSPFWKPACPLFHHLVSWWKMWEILSASRLPTTRSAPGTPPHTTKIITH